MDNRVLIFLATTASIIVAILIGAGVASGELMFPAIVILSLVAVALIANPALAGFLAIALYASGLTLPGLPGQLNLGDSMIIATGGCALMLIIFQRTKLPRFSVSHWLLLAFCTITFFTGLARGFGFQFLGSGMWGGFLYVKIFLAASLVFTLPRVNLPDRWWPVCIALMGLLAPITLCADLLVLHGGGSVGFINLFVQTGATINTELQQQEAGQGLGRLTSAGLAASSMIIAFLALVSTDKLFQWRKPIYALIALGIFFLSLLSGFRLITANLIVIIFAVALIQRSLTLPRVAGGLLVLAIGLVTAYVFAPSLPLSAQRTLSWLPGIQVSYQALGDAQGTVDWRFDVWREAIKYIPDYLWIGKGFSYDGNLFLAAQNGYAAFDPINWAMVTGAYHNGYLSLLLITGLAGFLTGLPLLVTCTWRHWRINHEPWNDARLHRCHQAFLGAQICYVGIFLTVYGDVSASFPSILFNWAIMEGLRECDQRLGFSGAREASSSAAPEESYAVFE